MCLTSDNVARAQKTRILLVAKAAVEKSKALRLYDLNVRAHSVTDVVARPHSHTTVAFSETRFVQGGDHFMTTCFNSEP